VTKSLVPVLPSPTAVEMTCTSVVKCQCCNGFAVQTPYQRITLYKNNMYFQMFSKSHLI